MYVNEITIQPQIVTDSAIRHQMSNSDNSPTTINIENVINITHDGSATHYPNQKSTSSPTPSLRSTSISIASIESDAASSVIESDIDEFEDSKTGCMVKKLGQQTTGSVDNNAIPNLSPEIAVLLGQQIERDVASSEAPKIASLTLTNSTDVTFGHKKYHRGPVTIQQILVEKPNENRYNNPAFEGSTGCPGPAERTKQPECDLSDQEIRPRGQNEVRIAIPELKNIKPGSSLDELFKAVEDDLAESIQFDVSRNHEPPSQIWKNLSNHKKAIITGIVVLAAILIGILIISVTFILQDGVLLSVDNISPLRMISRDMWVAQPPNAPLDDLETPVPRVIITQTLTQNCTTQGMCVFRTRFLQTFDIESKSFDDIQYNFLVGGDGNVYVGRGWDKVGAHEKGYNDDSISVAFIGTFSKWAPPEQQVNATKWLLEDGVRLNKLEPDFKIYPARKLSNGGGNALLKIISQWPNWSNELLE